MGEVDRPNWDRIVIGELIDVLWEIYAGELSERSNCVQHRIQVVCRLGLPSDLYLLVT